MDSLYQHVYEGGDPVQNSAGATNNYSRLTIVGEEKISPFNEHRTTSDISRHLRGTNRLDPLEYLPPELSTFVITYALPPQEITNLQSKYTSRLIELTTVSKKWQSLLFSTPVLWSELVIDGRQEDLLATLSLFVALSSDAPVQLFLPGNSGGIDWTGLASALLPGAKRVTCLHFGIFSDYDFVWVHDALSTFLDRLYRLPGLKEVTFHTNYGGEVFLFRIKPLRLPSTVKFNSLFRLELPESCRGSGTRSRFFDVAECRSSGTVPPSQPNLSVEYLGYSHNANIISNGTTLSQLESLAGPIAECDCFEQIVYKTSSHLHRLQVDVDLSQTEDLLDCLRMLTHLQVLQLQIDWGTGRITRDHTRSDATSHDLRRFELVLLDAVEDRVEAQKPLGDLFSALGILYPRVEEVYLDGSTWMDLEASYLQDLKALKSLALAFESSPLALPSAPITLQSVQRLEMRGAARLDHLRAPSLLKLVLQLGGDGTKLDHLGPFPRGLRSLAVVLEDDMKHFSLTSLDYPDLRDLYLRSRVPRASWGRPLLSNLVSIKVGSPHDHFTDSSSNQLCMTLLCYPWRLPSLRQLQFNKDVEWDVLFLMLKRRNCNDSGVQRIDTVTLPFIPFAFHKLLAHLLAEEIVELPSLTSLSLEATRELVFDPNVQGCFACLKNMRPGCTAAVVPKEEQVMDPVDEFYPIEDPVPEETPQEIRDWLSQRWKLVEMWKASYEEFALKFGRESICAAFPFAPL